MPILKINSKVSINYSTENSVASVVAYQDYQDGIFTHVGLSAHAHNIVQEVEWLLPGIEALDYTMLLFFDSCS